MISVMIDDNQLEDLIYEAALLPERWPMLLERLANATDAVGGVVFCVNQEASRWAASPTITEHMLDFIRDGWAQRNSRVHAGMQLGPAGFHRFLTESDFFPNQDPFSDPLYSDFFVPRGMGYSAGAMIELPHNDTIIVSLERSVRRGPFEQELLSLLNKLYPHLMRAGMIAGRMAFQAVRSHVEAYARLNMPVVAVSQTGTILATGPRWADEVHVWTSAPGDKLCLCDPKARTRLSRILENPLWQTTSQTIPLRATDGQTGFLHIVPIRRDARDLFGADTALMVLSKNLRPSKNAARMMEAILEITPAEAEVAALIAEGKSAKAIALRLGKSPETVRNQIRSIQTKLDCRKTTELVRLLSDLC